MRADAQRNREVIVVAATTIFGERGLTAPLELVARRAGVGIGTLYRHFPDREALILAVVQQTLEGLLALVQRSSEESPDAWGALQGYLRRCAELRAGGLMSTLDSKMHAKAKRQPGIRKTRAALYETLGNLVAQAQKRGDLRKDVGVGDVTLLAMLLSRRESELPEQLAEMLPGRFIELAIDGLRPPGTKSHPLPGSPPQL